MALERWLSNTTAAPKTTRAALTRSGSSPRCALAGDSAPGCSRSPRGRSGPPRGRAVRLQLPWLLVGLTTLLQRLTPQELQGRAYGIVGYRWLLVAMAARSAGAGAYLMRRYRRRVR